MAVNLDDVLRVTWQAKNETPNTTIQNIFWFKVADIPDTSDLVVFEDIRDEMLSMFGTIQIDFTTKYTLETIRVVNQTQKTFVGDETPIFSGTGVDADSLPAQCAVEVLARGSQLGHTGRKYIGPISDASMDDGDLVAAALARFNLFGAEYEEPFTGVISLNIYEPGTAKLGPGGVVISFRTFRENRFFVQKTCRTQRRRIPGVGLG